MPRDRANTIVIVGTSHSIQVATDGDNAPAGNELQDFLVDLCRVHRIRAVAEEMSAEALAQYNRAMSVPMRVAESLKIEHRCCDPDNAERAKLGICQDENLMRARGFLEGLSENEIASRVVAEHTKRERYWLHQIRSLNQWPVLFICGANHVAAFQSLLEHEGLAALVAANDWAFNSTPYPDARRAQYQVQASQPRAGGRKR